MRTLLFWLFVWKLVPWMHLWAICPSFLLLTFSHKAPQLLFPCKGSLWWCWTLYIFHPALYQNERGSSIFFLVWFLLLNFSCRIHQERRISSEIFFWGCYFFHQVFWVYLAVAYCNLKWEALDRHKKVAIFVLPPFHVLFPY